ncbi:hypothetical protein F444_14035 [Phytophthora nicotianae P1976]|uniref:Uncharacterized protein n=1 Tax=Phytophthora nicotianae P1976 TaxID=1317066 RepID=A0A080ZRW1_PHYNI|nr:hypothetical protein F444_14035 [Phytophthora nicotianae P1976]
MAAATERGERAQRRAASRERPASAVQASAKRQRQPGAATTVDTGDGVVVTLETSEIRPGRTGGLGAGRNARSDSQGVGRGNSASSGGGARDGRGDDTPPAGGAGSDTDASAGAGADDETDAGFAVEAIHLTEAGNGGGRGGGCPGRAPPAAAANAVQTGGRDLPPRQVIVRKKAKALKLTKFKGLDDNMPVTMWLKTVRAEVRRQEVTMCNGVQYRKCTQVT